MLAFTCSTSELGVALSDLVVSQTVKAEVVSLNNGKAILRINNHITGTGRMLSLTAHTMYWPSGICWLWLVSSTSIKGRSYHWWCTIVK